MDDWMSRLGSRNEKFGDIVIPGSHDAGMYIHCDWSGNEKRNPSASVITQDRSIFQQLGHGYRMFDLRVYRNNKRRLHCGHFPEISFGKLGGGRGKRDILGGFGASLYDVLADVVRFLRRDNSQNETVILKFSHIHEDNHRDVMEMVYRTIDTKLYDHGRDRRTIGSIPIRELRGKVIAIYEEGFVGRGPYQYKVINFMNPKKDETWDRIDRMEKLNKLILRGYYSNKRQYKDMKKKQIRLLQEWNRQGGKASFRGELMQLYWTSTWHPGSPLHKMNIKNNTAPLWKDSSRNELTNLIRRYKPNVVITDFADASKAYTILE